MMTTSGLGEAESLLILPVAKQVAGLTPCDDHMTY